MASLADEIDSTIDSLRLLLGQVGNYLVRGLELPADWDDDLTDAEEAADEARSAIGPASDFNDNIDRAVDMLRRIDAYEREAPGG